MAVKNESLVGFCSAAWTDLIAYNDGQLRVCDRNFAAFGNWQKDGLANTWNSDALQQFRKDTAEGHYPNSDCASCHNNGTQRTLISSLGCAYEDHYEAIERHLGAEFAEKNFSRPKEEIFPLKKSTATSDAIIHEVYKNLSTLEAKLAGESICKELRDALIKIRVIMECAEDYLHGTNIARRVAPFRQAQLQAKCNARCVMCAGKYTGEIMNGPSMPTEYVDECFSRLEDIVDFWCNGSEYMLYKDWQKVATMLYKDGGTKLRVSTNGILLNEKNVHFMIDNGMLAHLTVSLDGATKEVLESIRINVKYEDNLKKIRYLIEYAGKKKHFFTLVFAFCFMKRNYKDLPEFMRMIDRLRGEYKMIRMVALIQPLENFELPEYRKWVHNEHHDLIGQQEIQRVLEESHAFASTHDILVSFYNMKLDEFLAQKLPMPPYFVREMDEEVTLSRIEQIGTEMKTLLTQNKDSFSSRFRLALKRNLRALLEGTMHSYLEASLEPSKLLSPQKTIEQMNLLLLAALREQRKPLEEFLWQLYSQNSIMKAIAAAFPSVHSALKLRVFEHVDEFLGFLHLEGKSLVQECALNFQDFLLENYEKNQVDGNDVYTYKEPQSQNNQISLYYSQSIESMGLKISGIIMQMKGFLLLSNGEIISQKQLRGKVAIIFGKNSKAQKITPYASNNFTALEILKRKTVFSCFICLHNLKVFLLGNRKSVLLWKLSLFYRSTLRFFGIKATFIDG